MKYGTIGSGDVWTKDAEKIKAISNNEITGEEDIRETGEIAQRFLLEILK